MNVFKDKNYTAGLNSTCCMTYDDEILMKFDEILLHLAGYWVSQVKI
jgi:hypothetical protein